MKHLILFILLSISIFGQSELFLLMDDNEYTPPAGFEFFIDSDGKKVKTSEGEYFLVRTESQYYDNWYLTLTSVDSGYFNKLSKSYLSGSVFNLIATPNTGFNFITWRGDVSAKDDDTTIIIIDTVKTITARFKKTQTVRVIISDIEQGHADIVKSSFINGYELGGGTWVDSIETRIEELIPSEIYTDRTGADIIVRSTPATLGEATTAQKYYPTYLFMPSGSNSHLQFYDTEGILPALVLTGASNPDTNRTAWDVEFISIDPQVSNPPSSSFSNGYIAGIFAYVADQTDGNLWTARYLLRNALGNSWTPQEGYGKITAAIIGTAIVAYNPVFNYKQYDNFLEQ